MKNSTNFRNLLSRYVLEGLSFIEASLPSKPKSRSGRNFIKFPAPYTTNLSCSSCKQKKKKNTTCPERKKFVRPDKPVSPSQFSLLNREAASWSRCFFSLSGTNPQKGWKYEENFELPAFFVRHANFPRGASFKSNWCNFLVRTKTRNERFQYVKSVRTTTRSEISVFDLVRESFIGGYSQIFPDRCWPDF